MTDHLSLFFALCRFQPKLSADEEARGTPPCSCSAFPTGLHVTSLRAVPLSLPGISTSSTGQRGRPLKPVLLHYCSCSSMESPRGAEALLPNHLKSPTSLRSLDALFLDFGFGSRFAFPIFPASSATRKCQLSASLSLLEPCLVLLCHLS